MDLSLDPIESGYFLKPLFGEADSFPPTLRRSHLVITQPKGSVTVKGSYGPFTVGETLSPAMLQDSLGNHSTMFSNMVLKNMELSAHVVSRSITQQRPLLQVLFHASQVRSEKKAKNAKSDTDTNPKTKWCLQMHVDKDGVELTSVCVLSGEDNVCIAEITLPSEWWHDQQTQSAQVFYSVYQIDENLQCSSASNSIVPGKANADRRIKRYVSTVTLTQGQLTYQEVKEDQHILIYIPQKSFYTGSKFRIPVKLQAESDLELFVVR